MMIEKNITLYSYCEHHFLPIIGKAHVAFFSSEKLSAFKNQQAGAILRQAATGTGKAD
jgi:GTP cyclohydrolase I